MIRLVALIAAIWLPAMVMAQGVIQGQVTDENGEALPGANVVILELQKGASANKNGVYKIEGLEPGMYTLRFTFVGYEKEIAKTSVREGTAATILHMQLEERIFQIDELVVKATRADEKAPFTYTTVTKEELEANNLGQDVPFLLRRTPSAVVTSDAGTGIGYTGIRIRGVDPSRINVTINGIPLNDSESQLVFWVDLPDFSSSTDDIQIQRGVGTSTNGSGAFGGNINLNTTKVNRDVYGAVSGTVGSFNTWKSNVQFGSGLLSDRFIIEGRLSRIHSDGFIDRATADLQSYFLSGTWLGEKSSLRFNLFSGHERTYQAWYGVPAELVDDPETRTFNPAGMEKPGDPYEDEVDDYRQTHYQLLYNRQLTRNWNLNLGLHYTRGLGYFEQYKAGEALADYNLSPISLGDSSITRTDLVRRLWLDNHFYGGTWAAAYTSNGNQFRFTFGGSWNQYLGDHYGELVWGQYLGNAEPGQHYYDNDADKRDLNMYTKFQYELTEALSAFVDLQYRRVDYEFLGLTEFGDFATQEVSLNFFNPKAGLFYQIDQENSLYGSFAIANREPNRNDFLANPSNQRPSSERLYNAELGLRRNEEKSQLQANFYYMYYEDQLAVSGELNLVGEYLRVNIPRSYRVGLEVDGAWQFGKRWLLEGNATLSQNKIPSFTEFVDVYDEAFNYQGQQTIEHEDTDLAFSPDVIAFGGLTYRFFTKRSSPHKLDVSLLNKYIARQYLDLTSSEEASLDPYFFSDLRLQYAFKTNWVSSIELTLMVRNLLDAQFETNGWAYRYYLGDTLTQDVGLFPQAGTNFLLGATVNF